MRIDYAHDINEIFNKARQAGVGERREPPRVRISVKYLQSYNLVAFVLYAAKEQASP